MGTRVLAGKNGDIDLAGMKFWLAGDLGADWGTKGQADWLVVTFEPKATKEQKDALMPILTNIYPVKWNSVQMTLPTSLGEFHPMERRPMQNWRTVKVK